MSITNAFFDDFDVLVNNMLGRTSFMPINKFSSGVPYDMYIDEDKGLIMEFALVGAKKDDINVSVAGNDLAIKYHPPDLQNGVHYINRSISRKGFELTWRINQKFDISKLETSLGEGLLRIEIPYAQELLPKSVEIKLLD